MMVMSVISAMGHTHKILFVTARGSYLRDPTEAWLREFLPSHVKWNLHMRKSAHNDWIVKQAIFNEMIKDHFDVAFVLEDRDQCVNMWRRLGLKCWQVAKGDY